MVIQEAFGNGRPLMVSNIGGMAEKVRDGCDGIQVGVGSSTEWRNRLLTATNPEYWHSCHEQVRKPISFEECAGAHVGVLGSA